MARSISVKVPTANLIETIEAKIAEIDKAIADYPRLRDEYERDCEEYKKKVVSFATDFILKNQHLIGSLHDSVIKVDTGYHGRVELSFDQDAIAGFPKRPESPEKPNTHRYYGRDYSTQKELLEKNLKILKMTSQEEVSASTYGAVMELL